MLGLCANASSYVLAALAVLMLQYHRNSAICAVLQVFDKTLTLAMFLCPGAVNSNWEAVKKLLVTHPHKKRRVGHSQQKTAGTESSDQLAAPTHMGGNQEVGCCRICRVQF